MRASSSVRSPVAPPDPADRWSRDKVQPATVLVTVCVSMQQESPAVGGRVTSDVADAPQAGIVAVGLHNCTLHFVRNDQAAWVRFSARIDS